jgi:hypothetical protein
MTTIILGVLRVIWLRGLSALFGAWLNPALRVGITAAIGGVIMVTAYLFWPSGNAVERAVLEALGQRETITKANIDEEMRDNALLEEQERRMRAEREAAAKAPGAAADRIIWRADDPWLRAKRTAKAR